VRGPARGTDERMLRSVESDAVAVLDGHDAANDGDSGNFGRLLWPNPRIRDGQGLRRAY